MTAIKHLTIDTSLSDDHERQVVKLAAKKLLLYYSQILGLPAGYASILPD